MKKLLKIVLCMAVLFISLPVIVFAQEGGSILLGFDLSSYFVSLAAVAAFTVVVTNVLINLLKIPKFKQLLSWVVAIALAFLGWGLKLGIFSEMVLWWWVLIHGIGIGLIANGIFDIKVVQAILNFIGNLIKPKEE